MQEKRLQFIPGVGNGNLPFVLEFTYDTEMSWTDSVLKGFVPITFHGQSVCLPCMLVHFLFLIFWNVSVN